jgi:hypothetical protein
VLNVREVSGWKMVLPLDLFQQFEFRCKQVKIMEKKNNAVIRSILSLRLEMSFL